MGKAHRMLAVGLLGGSVGDAFPAALEEALDRVHRAVSKIHVALMPSKSPT